ncbi:MAG TPA: AAA family ATPase [Rickettsiales bacterium]|nr:AAA family ATPase [Rickettsiales bacterium]
MYESFYGLSGRPFSLLPDAAFLYPSARHKRVISLLEYGSVTQAGIIVISGEIGAGKTTAIRYYLKGLGQDVAVGLITNTSQSFGSMLQWVVTAFALDDTGDDVKLYNRFVDFLVAQYAKGKRTVLIMDEAQNLTVPMMEDLRMLSNVNNDKDQLLQIVLSGQPSLLNTLKHPDLHQLVQRVAIHCHLTPLSARETANYIRHRLGVVGGAPELFDDTACAAVYFFTGGVPRLINLLCDHSLAYAFAEDMEQVRFQTVIEVVADRDSAGLSAFCNKVKGQTEDQLLAQFRGIMNEIRELRESA